jgi:hypothetical protein
VHIFTQLDDLTKLPLRRVTTIIDVSVEKVGIARTCILRVEDGSLGEIVDLALEMFSKGILAIVLCCLVPGHTYYVWAVAVIAAPGWSQVVS